MRFFKCSGFLCQFLCVVLLASLLCSAAAADIPDLSTLTDTELVDLLTAVNEAIVSRGINKTAKLPKGAYIGGKDLPAGKYIYTCLATGEDWGNVTVYSEEGKGKQLLWNVVMAPAEGQSPETIYITLNEGDELKSGVPFSLQIMTGVLFQ